MQWYQLIELSKDLKQVGYTHGRLTIKDRDLIMTASRTLSHYADAIADQAEHERAQCTPCSDCCKVHA